MFFTLNMELYVLCMKNIYYDLIHSNAKQKKIFINNFIKIILNLLICN